MRNLNFPIVFGLATLSGCLWFLSVTPFDFALLAWIASVPMLLAVDRSGGLRRSLFLGWWAGVVETAGGFYWLMDVMHRFADFPWIGCAAVFLLFCAARGLIFLVFTAIVCGVRRRRALPMTLLAPIAMVTGEWLVPQIFPCGQWISQAWQPLVIQISELTGAFGVTALLMMVNGAIYDVASRRRAAWIPALSAAVLLTACLIYGAIRMHQVDAQTAQAPRLKVGLVQPNFAYSVSGDDSREEILRQLHALQTQSSRLQRDGAQALLWSEGSYPITLPRNFEADYPQDSLGMVRRGFDLPTIIGANTYDAAREEAFNSAVLLDAAGRVAGRYDKVELLAFGEYVPLVDSLPWLRALLPDGAGRFTRGAHAATLGLETTNHTWQLAPVICYEDILQSYLREVGRLRPNLLINLTSDSWFGAGTEPWEHLALSVFATVELRVSMVRAVNSGVSVLIDPNGRVLEKTYANDPYRHPRDSDGIVVAAPMMPPAHTWFLILGNTFAYLCAAASGLLLAGSARALRRRH